MMIHNDDKNKRENKKILLIIKNKIQNKTSKIIIKEQVNVLNTKNMYEQIY